VVRHPAVDGDVPGRAHDLLDGADLVERDACASDDRPPRLEDELRRRPIARAPLRVQVPHDGPDELGDRRRNPARDVPAPDPAPEAPDRGTPVDPAPTPPREPREPLDGLDRGRVVEELRADVHVQTGDLEPGATRPADRLERLLRGKPELRAVMRGL